MRLSWMFLGLAFGLVACSNTSDEAKELVAAQLRDPSSAQFREVRVVKQADGSEAVCGEVNGKNAYGGYAGFTGFVVKGSEVHIRDDDLSMSGVGEIEALTAAIQASTKYCILAGRTIEEIEASTAQIREQIDAAGP